MLPEGEKNESVAFNHFNCFYFCDCHQFFLLRGLKLNEF